MVQFPHFVAFTILRRSNFRMGRNFAFSYIYMTLISGGKKKSFPSVETVKQLNHIMFRLIMYISKAIFSGNNSILVVAFIKL